MRSGSGPRSTFVRTPRPLGRLSLAPTAPPAGARSIILSQQVGTPCVWEIGCQGGRRAPDAVPARRGRSGVFHPAFADRGSERKQNMSERSRH